MRAKDPVTGLTPQQEVFAQRVAEGKTQADAYLEAYPASRKWQVTSVYTQAAVLMNDRHVANRVADLRRQAELKAIERIAYTVETAMAECKIAMDLAIQKEQPAALVSAIRLRAELQRLLVQQSETRQVDEWGVPRKKQEASDLIERIQREAKARAKTPAVEPKG